jgi:2-dehydro-3-deoxyphosphogluconate aldolase/(4S)-4-hydroxy-2-oxoglutarate aldolase
MPLTSIATESTADIVRLMRGVRVHPVIILDDVDHAVPTARALHDGGVPVAEITMRTPCATDGIRAIAAECPDVLVGAGTVLTPAQAADARAAGARFFVTPGLNPAVVEYCIEHAIPIFPGICTPSELESAMRLGLSAVKFFPAEPMGGAAFLTVMASPYSGVCFLPSGGITPDTLPGYLALGIVVSCGCNWLAPRDTIRAGDFGRITQNASRTIAVARGVRR